MSEELMSIAEIRERLITTDKGAVKQCIRNAVTVLQNDPKFKGVICYNMMTDRNDIVKDLGWYRESPVLTDSDIDHIMLYLEENYSLTTEKKIKSAINVVAMENKYHPIQEKLNSLVWDKKERIKDVLYHFLGADRNVYTYEAMKVLLLGAISRVFRPGTKFEYMLILVGGQGAGKSTFFRFLAMNDSWFTDDLKKLDDENVFRKMQGHLIIELSEMIATASARSIEDIKSFISRQSDIYKVPYETQPKDRPRQCVFGGTSNAMDTLPLDRTGNRRFMPVMVYPERAECHILDNEASSREYIEQVWAEAMEIFRSGDFRLMLSKDSSEYLKDYQKQFMPEDADAGMILAFLDDFKGDRVCSKLLWKEALHRDYEPKRIELKQICDIMNNSVTDWVMSDGAMHFGDYGKQRGWVRVGSSQEIPDKADSDGFLEIPKQLELEIPFK